MGYAFTLVRLHTAGFRASIPKRRHHRVSRPLTIVQTHNIFFARGYAYVLDHHGRMVTSRTVIAGEQLHIHVRPAGITATTLHTEPRMSNENTSTPNCPRPMTRHSRNWRTSARATKGDINIDELSTAIQRGNRLFAFLSSGIAKIKAEIEDHAPDGITQSKPS